nr:hypothetical protein [Tanacetum cinerariifolium]
PTHYNQNSSTRTQQAATKNRGKAIVNSHRPIYDPDPSMIDDDDEMSKDKEIDKLMALISLSFKKIYKPTNNNLRTSSNTSRTNQDNSLRIHKNAGYEHQRLGNVAGARETIDAVDSGPIFDKEPKQKKSKANLKRRDNIEYATEMELACAKVRGDLLSYKMESEKSCNKYTQTINDLNQTISEMKNKLSAHQDTISILKQQKDAQIKPYNSREDKEIEKVIDLENKVKNNSRTLSKCWRQLGSGSKQVGLGPDPELFLMSFDFFEPHPASSALNLLTSRRSLLSVGIRFLGTPSLFSVSICFNSTLEI